MEVRAAVAAANIQEPFMMARGERRTMRKQGRLYDEYKNLTVAMVRKRVNLYHILIWRFCTTPRHQGRHLHLSSVAEAS